jgi:iron complex outermembrane receptor protein
VLSRNILDARITYVPFDALSIEAFATNVLDQTYVASQVQDSSTAFGGFIFGAPAQYGARVKFSF